jgi:hypothetical protein
MRAHRDQVTIPEDRVITIRLPPDVPTGQAEVIVLTEEPAERPAPAQRARTFDERFPRNPKLGPILFNEDPTAPLSEDDWPLDQRP